MLSEVPTSERIERFTSFAQWVREENCGNGSRVRAAAVQVALCAIGKTFEMDGRPTPPYRSEGKYWLAIERLIEAFRRQDPPAQHKLAVHVAQLEQLQNIRKTSPSQKVQAICDMCTIAFYSLFRVGEYTRKPQNRSSPHQAIPRVCHHDLIRQIT
jgi:hypothetical protein